MLFVQLNSKNNKRSNTVKRTLLRQKDIKMLRYKTGTQIKVALPRGMVREIVVTNAAGHRAIAKKENGIIQIIESSSSSSLFQSDQNITFFSISYSFDTINRLRRLLFRRSHHLAHCHLLLLLRSLPPSHPPNHRHNDSHHRHT